MSLERKIVLKTEDLVKTFGEGDLEVHAVDHISLEVREGEFTAIKGPSGSGKTTLLNLLGGLDEPTDGRVIVDGIDLSKLSRNELVDLRLKKIGFVFQAYNLIPVLTARENTEFIMLLQDRPKEERTQRAEQLLHAVGLEGHEDKRPGKLSGGQQQRVAVARALAPKPAFILADEPTANLDSKSTENLLDIMKKLNEEEHVTFVFATHDDRVIQRAKRVITVDDGKIVNDEWKEELVG
ncbi:MAG: ABC transporter ATP-binding protein [Bacteroidota bacterium]|nr:ABC transporter ATP-binding protein [Bacteroidota bacterium]MDX5427209.1 ABC transporter ATP-binding protein [Bacteroidota bacterium]MDX5446923.1 ABC transporter ATP-binding protein [Bacteroidota bacterium]MDX5505171.1 ABC transporter ATP-binding protein [Bacteroidota bacterium]